MKNLRSYLTEKLLINKNFKDNKITVTSLKELKNIIKERYVDPNTKKPNNHIDLSDIDVSELNDLSTAFLWYRFKTIDISGWDTSNVKDMTMMFYGCFELTDIIGIENMNIDNVERMDYMFSDCKKLDITDKIKDWKVNPKNVRVSGMFRECPTKFKFTVK